MSQRLGEKPHGMRTVPIGQALSPEHRAIAIRIFALTLALVILSPAPIAADAVVASDRVRSRVIVRERPDTRSPDVGSIRPGDRAQHLSSVAHWHHVRLADDTQGFVSASWTRRIPEPPPEPPVAEAEAAATRPNRSMLRSLTAALEALFTPAARVDFVMREPELGRSLYRHFDPKLPVSGFATASGMDGRHDIMLVIDASTSTNEYAGADVNGDGRFEDAWKGEDSVFKAELAASVNFIRTLNRLPSNHDGRRIRVGIVTFSGGEGFYRRPEDEGFRATNGRIHELATRDAELQMPLTSDYDAVERKLLDLSAMVPAGMTDVAAGIGRAIIELQGMEGEGAQSRPRHASQKAMLLLSDGEPRLPFGRFQAARAAVYAARMAARANIRIHSFALGYNAVTRVVNDSIKTVAAETRGRFVALQNPADIASILTATSFSYVDKVKLINRTTHYETRYVTTGIDGSFYGEMPLQEGENEIEVVAVLYDEREASERFLIEYEFVPPTRELVEKLEKIRGENRALLDQIKDELAREIEAARAERQRKLLEVSAEAGPGR